MVTVEGSAETWKLGAFLAAKPEGLWIDGLRDWPDGVAGKRVRVTGRVVERSDLPVVVQPPPGAPIPQGIPVDPGTDVERARHRFLLADAKWTVID